MNKPQILNRSQVAAVFGFNRSTIGDWMLKGCPLIRRGRHGQEAQLDFEKLLAWRLDDLRRQGVEEEYLTLDAKETRACLKELRKAIG